MPQQTSRLFRPDQPVETFGLVPRAACTSGAFVPLALLAASVLAIAAVLCGSLP